MRFIVNAVKSIIKRPILIWFIAVFTFPPLFFLDRYSLLRYISGEQGIGSLKLFDTYLLILSLGVKYLSSLKNLSLIFLSLLVFSIIAGLVAGALFSGYFYILHKSVNSYKAKKSDFFNGIKKNYLGVFKVCSVSIFLTGMVLTLISFIFVPSVVTLNALLAGKAELFFILVLFSIVTVFVLFFSFTFYRIYILYWLPAVISFKKNSFKAGRHVANNNFWRSMITIIFFDIIFIFSRFLYYSRFISINAQEVVSKAAQTRLFISNWLFFIFFIYIFLYYLFYSFKNSRDQVM